MKFPISPPIILDNHGDLRFFRTLQDAEAYAEPIDVGNEEYVGYDSRGRGLSLSVVSSENLGIVGRLGGRQHKVTISANEETPLHAEDLREALIGFLRRVGVSQQWLNSASLNELVQKGLSLQGG